MPHPPIASCFVVRRAAIVLASLLYLGAWGLAAAADEPTELPPTERSRQAIAASIQNLGHREYRMRERAERELQAFGLLALEQLEEAALHEDIEVRLRARFLVAGIRGQMIAEFVRPEFSDIMEGYERRDLRSRRDSLMKLTQLTSTETLPLLARLARFEESELLAREAALAVIATDLTHQENLDELRKAILQALGFNQRPPVQWIRTTLQRYDDVVAAAEQLEPLISDETRLLNSSSGRTDAAIVQRLRKIHIDLLQLADRTDEAIAKMARLDFGDEPEIIRLNVDWVLERGGFEAVIEQATTHAVPFARDALLRYRLAEAYARAGKDEDAETVAQEAFALQGGGIEVHSRSFRSLLYFISGALLQRGNHRAMRLATAILLEDDRGRFDWAEQEYRAALSAPPENAMDATTYEQLANLLYEGKRPAEAAEVLSTLLEFAEKDKSLQVALAENDESGKTSRLDRLASQVHFFRGLAQRGNPAAARQEFQKGIEKMPRNTDLLIAMFRLQGATDAFRQDTRNRIETMIEQVQADVDEARLQWEQSDDPFNRTPATIDLAHYLNEYAWLVGNTIGDIDKAIACSERSLELSPGNFGYQDTLARCLYRKGDLDRALELQRLAAKAAPFERQIVGQLAFFESEANKAAKDPSQDSPLPTGASEHRSPATRKTDASLPNRDTPQP